MAECKGLGLLREESRITPWELEHPPACRGGARAQVEIDARMATLRQPLRLPLAVALLGHERCPGPGHSNDEFNAELHWQLEVSLRVWPGESLGENLSEAQA